MTKNLSSSRAARGLYIGPRTKSDGLRRYWHFLDAKSTLRECYASIGSDLCMSSDLLGHGVSTTAPLDGIGDLHGADIIASYGLEQGCYVVVGQVHGMLHPAVCSFGS